MNRIFATTIEVIQVAGLYYGLAHGVEGALNIGLFLAWFAFALSFGALSSEVGKKIGEIPTWAVAKSLAFDCAAIALLAWHGWMLTAAAVTWAALITFGAWMNNRKEQAA